MIRRPPRSTLSSSSAASDVYKRQRAVHVTAALRELRQLVTHWTTNRVQVVSRPQDINRSRARLHILPAYTGRRHDIMSCCDDIAFVVTRLQQRQPFFHGRSGDSATVRSLSLYPRMESATDRTETHALVDNNIQASPIDIHIQLNIHLPLTMECAIGLTAVSYTHLTLPTKRIV